MNPLSRGKNDANMQPRNGSYRVGKTLKMKKKHFILYFIITISLNIFNCTLFCIKKR